MDVKHLNHLTLFNRGVNGLGNNDEIKILFPNVSQLSIEINLISKWKEIFRLSEQLPNLKLLDLNFNYFTFEQEQVQFLNDFKIVESGPGRIL